jgi:hypothetical protein
VSTAAFSARVGRVQTAVASVPIWAWLSVVFVLSVLFRFALSLEVHAPWVFQDELVYGDLAKSLGETGHFAIRNIPGTNGFGPLYPALIAPAWAISASAPKAYVGAKLINALLMSLALVPTYVIARRLMRPSLAVVAAVSAVAIPSLAYTNTLLSENAFYPAVMAAAAALVLLLERPTLLRVAAFFLFTVLAFLVRAQGVILLGALVGSILILALANAWNRWPRPGVFGRELLRYWLPLAAVAAGAVAVSAYEMARGRPLKAFLGTYSGVTSMQHPLQPTLRWTLHHFGELDLYVGVIPFAAMIVIATLALARREHSPQLRAFAAASVALIFVFVLTASVYAIDPTGQRIEERYMFHVAPLFFVALLAWIDRGLPRPLPIAGAAAAIAAGLAALVPYDQLITSDVVHDAFALVPLLSLELRGTITGHSVTALVGVAAIIAASLAVAVPPRHAWVLVAVVFSAYAVAELRPIQRRIVQASKDADRAGITVQRNWVDRHVGPHAKVGLLTYGGPTALPWFENEFFNRSVRRVYTLSGPYDSLPRTDVHAQPSGELRDAEGTPVKSRYVLAHHQVVVNGRVLARDPGTGMTLYETDGPARIKGIIDGVGTDEWSDATPRYTQYDCRGGTLRVHVLSDPNLYHRGVQTLAATMNNRPLAQKTVPTTRSATFSVPLPRNVSPCVVNFTVAPTAVPAQVLPNTGDTRQLGIRFLGFTYRPA